MRRLGAGVMVSALLLAACGTASVADDSQATPVTTAPGESDPTISAPTNTTDDATTSIAAMAEIGALNTDLGTILVDADGFALYLFTPDADGESACTSTCADNWPPLPPTDIGESLDVSIFSVFDRSDGGQQMAVNGHPLYRFSGDRPGETNGQGTNGVWFVVDVDGEGIGLTNSDLAPDDNAYDY